MAEISEFVGSEPLDLDKMVAETKPVTPTAPESSIKTRAAFASLLLDNPEKIPESYQSMVAEGKEGQDFTRKQIVDRAKNIDSAQDIRAITNIFADKNLNQDQKLQAIENYRNGFSSDTATIVGINALVAPVKDESHEAEQVRISGADQFREVREMQNYRQGVINRQKVLINQDGAYKTAFKDLLEMIFPFATNIHASEHLTKIAKEVGVETNAVKAALLPGSLEMDIKESLAKMPVGKRLEVSQNIGRILQENKGIIYQDENKYNAYLQLQNIIGGEYSNVDKWLDNTVTLLDVFSLGGAGAIKNAYRRLTKPLAAEEKVIYKEGEYIPRDSKEESKATKRGFTSSASYATPGQVLKETNPEKAKALLKGVEESSGDEFAQATFGASKSEVLFDAKIPQIAVDDGSVATKILQEEVTVDPDLIKAVEDDGAIYYSERERTAARANVVNDIKSLKGVTIHDNMASVRLDGNQLKIDAMFAMPEGGFLKPDEAINQIKFALQDYGIVEKDLQLMKRVAGEYVPVDLASVKGVDGDYMVKAAFDYSYSLEDVGSLDKVDVLRNYFDRIPALRTAKSGTLANHLMDHASMLHPLYTNAAFVANDRSVKIDKILLKEHAKFSDTFVSLPKDRQAKLFDHIREANANSLALSDMELTSRGFKPDEIQALKYWRKAWDTHYFFENADLGRTLTHQGYKLLDNGQDYLFAKPVPKNQNIVRVYDPMTQSERRITKVEQDALYDSGGFLASLRRPIDVNGRVLEHVWVANNTGSYLRTINKFDQVLNYRKGYFQVRHTAPKYIEQIVRDNSGAEIGRKVVDVAGSTEEANHLASRYATNSGGNLSDYNIRGDINDLRPDTDAYWDLMSASGRIAQRQRGKLLNTVTNGVSGFDSAYVMNPVESAIRSARSLSGRLATREQLEVSKSRALAQYGEFFPSNGMGGRKWVENSNSLVNPGNATSKQLADARSTVEYLNYLQHGYDNAFDDFFKGNMLSLADIFQEKGFTKGEKAAIALSEANPTSVLKGGVYQAYIALNPFRQFMVQGNQALRATAIAPKYTLSGKLAIDGSLFLSVHSGAVDVKTLSKENREMVEFVQGSNMLDAIDRHVLVRGSLSDLAESSNAITRNFGKILEIPRRLGFDTGEGVNMISHLLAVRSWAKEKGMNLADKSVRDNLYAQARAMTYGMNHAGDMAYNQNGLGLFLQFLQVAHKAFLQYTNRQLPVEMKMKFLLTDMLIWGVPGAAALEALLPKDSLPDDPKVREGVLFGLESVALNHVASKLAGAQTNLDFSSLSPFGTDGFAHLFKAMATGGMSEFIANSPAFSLYFKEGSKMREALGRMARYTGVIDTQAGQDPEDMKSVLKGIAEISSGWSNAAKAQLIYETGKIQDKKGNILMNDANWAHAVAQMFGFKSLEEGMYYKFNEDVKSGSKAHKDAVNQWYNDYVRVLARDQKLSNQDDEFNIKVLGAMKLMWKDDLVAMGIINNNLKRDIVLRQDKIVRDMLRYSQIPDAESNAANIRNLQMLRDPKIDNVKRLFDDMQNQINKKDE